MRHAGDGFVVARASCLNIYRAVAVSGARRSGIARRFVLGQRLAGEYADDGAYGHFGSFDVDEFSACANEVNRSRVIDTRHSMFVRAFVAPIRHLPYGGRFL